VRRLATVAAVLFAAQLVSAPVTSAAEGASCPAGAATASTPVTEGQSATRRPVVFVHGWTGNPMTDAAAKLRQELGDRISTFTFDYSRWALYWASDDHIAPCLADYINGISEAHKKVRGDGKVVVIAHSMGGLALRYAMDGNVVKTPVTAATVSDIITLGTPHLGSPWGGPGVAEWWSEVLTHFGRERPPSNANGGRCLARHDKGAPLAPDCGPLPPYLPAGVTLTQLAGDITVDRTLFGFTVYSLPLYTDGVVPVPSAHGYVTSGNGGFGPPDMAKAYSRTDTCHVDSGKANRAAEQLSFAPRMLFDYLTLKDLQRGEQTPRVLAASAGAMLAAPCGHPNLPTDQSAVNQVTEVLKAMPPAKPIQPPADPHTIRFDGIGEYSLRLTAADLLDRGYTNEGNLYSGADAECVSFAKADQPLSFSVESATGRVLAINNASGDQSLRTEVGGIRVGSTLAQLRTAFADYQIEEHLDLDFGQGTNGMIVNGPGGAIGFSLDEASASDYASGNATISYLAGVGLPGHAPTLMEDGC
jgi:pimeloyl-ACP methyl ester carboxylesterase